jgi:hypothetical protein
VKTEIGKVKTEADMDVVTRMVGDIHDKINAILFALLVGCC